jgi:hypothetical protein
MEYKDFIKQKELIDIPTGIIVDSVNEKLFDWQADITKWALRIGRSCIFADCGLGKGQPESSKILTTNGYKAYKDLRLDDLVFDSKGVTRRIKGIYPKKEIDTYRFYYSDKTSHVFDIDHLHICRTMNDRTRKKKWRVLSTKELLDSKLNYGNGFKRRVFDIPIVEPIQFSKKELYISPYIIGVLLGDGHLKGNISISNNDKEIINRFNNELPDGLLLKQKSKYDYSIMTGDTGNRRHKFREELHKLGLLNLLSYDKFIPEKYLYSDINDRLQLLKGLMDTDGYIRDTCQYYSASEKLINDVKFLIQSLGGVPIISKKRGKYKKDGIIHECRTCYMLTFSLKTFNPFYVSRKAILWNKNPRDNGRWIDKIEYEKKQKTICISVDSPDESYVIDDCIVTHNTPVQLSWSECLRKQNKDILIVAPLAVSSQTVKEGEKFNVEVEYKRDGNKSKCGITITNYEMLHYFNPNDYSGIVLDESGILKSFTGKFRNYIIETWGKNPFKLACTATPAPNDLMELGNHSEFIGNMTRTEMLSMFFVHDGGETQKWRLKKHAESDYWKWICSWAVMIRKPSDLGYEDGDFILPELRIHEIVVDVDHTQAQETLFLMDAKTLQERQKARRDTVNDRCEMAASLTNSNNDIWLLWCDRNIESECLKKMVNGAKQISGSDSHEYKINTILGFINKDIKRLVTKPSIAGFGLNLQHCNKVIFVGLSDSYEQFYQAIRRCWRFGQKNIVDCYIITSSIEGAVVANIKRKEEQAAKIADGMIKHMQNINKINIKGISDNNVKYNAKMEMELPNWLK